MKKKVILLALVFMGMAAFSQEKGRVLNIRCWNEEFMYLVKDFYPGYDSSSDTIGDVKVNWIITPSIDGSYMTSLDEALLTQNSAKPDEKLDLFLVEDSYALKYLDTDYTMPIKDLGITDEDLKHQFKYAKQLGSSSDGKLKSLCWHVCPGVFVYRRSIAKKVLGTDNPEVVQKMIDTWDKFDDVARKMDIKHYYMLSGYDDDFRMFYDNMKFPWVVNGKINIDDSMKAWVKQAKTYTDEFYNCDDYTWSPEWFSGMMIDGRVFGYFGPSWFVDYVIPHGWDSNSASGDWAVCCGPQSFNWGGTWVCVANGTDNADLIKDIFLRLTCDEKVMEKIAYESGDIVNNDSVLAKIAADEKHGNEFLGGMNPFSYYLESAKSIDKSNVTVYDQVFNEVFLECMLEYIKGIDTEKQAYNKFYSAILNRFPFLKK